MENFCCCCSPVANSCPTPWIAECYAPLSSTMSWRLLKFMSFELAMLSNHLILCCPVLLLPSIIPSIRVFSNESALHIRWPKLWSFSFSISPSKFIQGWFPLGLTGLISLLSKGLSRVFSSIGSQSVVWGPRSTPRTFPRSLWSSFSVYSCSDYTSWWSQIFSYTLAKQPITTGWM